MQEERVVARDNTVSFEGLKLQLPESPLRHRFVKARVRVHRYPDGALAVFHGPRCLARYDAGGVPIASVPTRPRPRQPYAKWIPSSGSSRLHSKPRTFPSILWW